MSRDGIVAEDKEGFFEETKRKRGRRQVKMSEDEEETLKLLSKIDKNKWKDIRKSLVSMADFVSAGGVSGLKEEMKSIIQENVQVALGPIYNELQPIINEVMRAIEPLMPFIVDIVKWATDILVPIVQWIADVLQEIIDFFTGRSLEEQFPGAAGWWEPGWGTNVPAGMGTGGVGGHRVIPRDREFI